MLDGDAKQKDDQTSNINAYNINKSSCMQQDEN